MQGWDRRPKAFQILGRAIESVWQIVISAPWLLPGAMVVYALVSVGAATLSNFLPVSLAQELSQPSTAPLRTYASVFPLQLLQLAASAFTTGILAFPCVIICRHILLDETGFRPPLPILGQYAAWNFALSALILASGQAAYFFDSWWISLIPTITGFALSVPLSLVFPGLAIGVKYENVSDRVRIGLRHLRGNFWLVVRAYLILLAITVTAVTLLYLPSVLFSRDPIEIAPASWPVLSFEAVIMVITTCLAAASVTWLYVWAVPSPQWLDNFD